MDVVIIHGYSDKWKNMKEKLGDPLLQINNTLPANEKLPDLKVHYINYKSTDDEASYEDYAEGVYEELRKKDLLTLGDGKLHFIVHSTGGLVIRQLMRQYEWDNFRKKAGNVVFLAPANFGSPLAHKARSVFGRLAKADKEIGDDFLEIGTETLKGLELASPLQWDLAHFDLFSTAGTIYGGDKVRGYILTGCKPYGGLRSIVNEDGTDGTIVVSGANLNSRKLVLDFVQRNNINKADWQKGPQPNLPFAIHNSLDHSTILKIAENDAVRKQIFDCLRVSDAAGYDVLEKSFTAFRKAQLAAKDSYQQFVFRIMDDRNVPVKDYHIQFNVWDRTNTDGKKATKETKRMSPAEEEKSHVLDQILKKNGYTNSSASQLKRFLVKPEDIKNLLGQDYVITISILTDTKDDQIHYDTDSFENSIVFDPLQSAGPTLFYENTTTLVDVMVDRYTEIVDLF